MKRTERIDIDYSESVAPIILLKAKVELGLVRPRTKWILWKRKRKNKCRIL